MGIEKSLISTVGISEHHPVVHHHRDLCIHHHHLGNNRQHRHPLVVVGNPVVGNLPTARSSVVVAVHLRSCHRILRFDLVVGNHHPAVGILLPCSVALGTPWNNFVVVGCCRNRCSGNHR